MTDDKGKYAPPFSLRFTVEERLKLDADAGDLAIAEYIRSQLFQNPSKRLRPFRRPIQDGKALGEVLAALGRSRLSSNLNQLAKAVHSGSLPVTPETEKAILDAVKEVHDMSSRLVKALGLPEDNAPRPPDGGGR